jgi:hypothetical protein
MEDVRTLYVDPGEDTGWCVGRGLVLLSAGTHKMWDFADDVWELLMNPSNPNIPQNNMTYARRGIAAEQNSGPIERIVCENWRIYPWEAEKGHLNWDECRTARLIGALTFMARLKGIPFITQGADIKEGAVAAGAEELFYKPLKENRHQNDALMHFVFFTNSELLGKNEIEQITEPIDAVKVRRLAGLV